MNEYELMTVFHPRLNADETTAAVTGLEEQIVAHGGEMLSTDNWGRRRLAYPIDGVVDGTYVLMTFRMPPGGTAALERWMRLSETTLRHLLIRGIIPFEGDHRERDRDDREDRYRDGEPSAEDASEDDARPAGGSASTESADDSAEDASDAPGSADSADSADAAAGESEASDPAEAEADAERAE